MKTSEAVNPINSGDEKDPDENNFRQRAIKRLTQEHADLGQETVERWLNLLNDECDGDKIMAAKSRSFAATAVWAMMDVRDLRRT